VVVFYAFGVPKFIVDPEGKTGYSISTRCTDDEYTRVFNETFYFETEEYALQFVREVNYNMEGLTIG
jgi:hypothetical protein